MANLLCKTDQIRERVKEFPTLPGCYIMHDCYGAVLYVGKAKNIKSRALSYFRDKNLSPKTKILISHVDDIEFIVTSNETEALILENSLIKEHSPKYNICLKDDRTYPYLLANMCEDYPTIKLIRTPPKELEDQRIFGPFVVGSGIKEVLQTLLKIYKIRNCSITKFRRAKVPCLSYQMNNCEAPCCIDIQKDSYLKNFETAISIIEGEGKKAIGELKKEMILDSELEKFEKAAELRDAIDMFELFQSKIHKQSVEYREERLQDADFIHMHRESDVDLESELLIFHVRKGKLLGNSSFFYKHFSWEEEDVADRNLSFIFSYYNLLNGHLPETVIVSNESSFDLTIFKSVIAEKFRKKVKVKRGGVKKYPLLASIKQQAIENRRVREKRYKYASNAAAIIQELLKSSNEIRFIECFDVAIFQGSSPVAAKVAFRDGRPDKENYRHYKLKERVEGNNDYAMMREAFSRRLKSGKLPDLFLIDGGRGQVNICKDELTRHELAIPIIGIAKGGDGCKYDRLIFEWPDSEPYILDEKSVVVKLVTKIRDEAHRFSRTLHHKLEKKRVIASK